MGAKMLVKDVMTTELVTVKKELGIRDLAQLFVDKDISGAPVLGDDGAYQGVVLEESLIYQDKKIHMPTFLSLSVSFLPLGIKELDKEIEQIAASTAGEIMDTEPYSLAPDTKLEDVATLMVEKGLHYFPVLDDGDLVGVVTKKDIVKAIAKGQIH